MSRLAPKHCLPLLCALVCCLSTGIAFASEAPSPEITAEVTAPEITAKAPSVTVTEAPALPAIPEKAPDVSSPEDWGGPVSALGAAVKVQNASTCSDCDSNQNYCSNGAQCNSFCQALVGENGFCMPSCNCCVCPEIRPGGGGGDPGGGPGCTPVCRCGDGVSGPQGVCPSGCRQVSCL